jgi:hypothetical protein
MTFSKLKEMNPTLYETLLPLCKSINTSQYNYDHMSDHDIKKDTEFENGNESGNGFDTQEPQQEERRELTREELSLMDLVTHKNKPTLVLDFNKDPKKRIEAKHTFDIKIGPVPITYFVATLPDDPDYEQYYRVTSSKLRRAIINRYLAKDKTRLEITRTGSTQRDTVYRIRALEDDKVRVITSDSEYWEPLPQQQQRL